MEYNTIQNSKNMMVLDTALREAYQLCYSISGFHTGVYVSSMRTQPSKVIGRILSVVVDSLSKVEFNYGWVYYRANRSYDLVFPNGSSIRTILGSHNSRGYKFHYIICDKTIVKEVKECVIQPSLMPQFDEFKPVKYIECVI